MPNFGGSFPPDENKKRPKKELFLRREYTRGTTQIAKNATFRLKISRYP